MKPKDGLVKQIKYKSILPMVLMNISRLYDDITSTSLMAKNQQRLAAAGCNGKDTVSFSFLKGTKRFANLYGEERRSEDKDQVDDHIMSRR